MNLAKTALIALAAAVITVPGLYFGIKMMDATNPGSAAAGEVVDHGKRAVKDAVGDHSEVDRVRADSLKMLALVRAGDPAAVNYFDPSAREFLNSIGGVTGMRDQMESEFVRQGYSAAQGWNSAFDAVKHGKIETNRDVALITSVATNMAKSQTIAVRKSKDGTWRYAGIANKNQP
jgi:hypothetical protein